MPVTKTAAAADVSSVNDDLLPLGEIPRYFLNSSIVAANPPSRLV